MNDTTTSPIAVDPECLEDLVSLVVGQAAERILEAHGSQGGLDVSKAWLFQKTRDKKKLGAEKAPWYVGFYDPEMNRCSKRCGPKNLALKHKRQIEAQLLTGTYKSGLKKSWREFRQEYREKVLASKAEKTRRQAEMSLDNFERIAKPKTVGGIKTAVVDGFVAKRRVEGRRLGRLGADDFEPHRPRSGPLKDRQVWRRKSNGRIYRELPVPAAVEPVAPASVNADLRNLKAALGVAEEWGYLEKVPTFRMVREPKRLPRYVLPEHFAAIYLACDHARLPLLQGIAPADWWRALLVMTYQATGWRIGQLLALRRDELDLAAGTVVASAEVEGNKAKEERLVLLHPVALEHLRRLPGFGPQVFAWPHDPRTLSAHFHEIQRRADIHLPCRKDHQHRPACHVYGFHNLRKGFGSMNAPRLPMTALQHLMQHQSLQTTQKFYVNPLAEQQEAVGKLYVPDVLKTATG